MNEVAQLAANQDQQKKKVVKTSALDKRVIFQGDPFSRHSFMANTVHLAHLPV